MPKYNVGCVCCGHETDTRWPDIKCFFFCQFCILANCPEHRGACA